MKVERETTLSDGIAAPALYRALAAEVLIVAAAVSLIIVMS